MKKKVIKICDIFLTLKKLDKFKDFANYIYHYNRRRVARQYFSKNFQEDILPTLKFLEEKLNYNKKYFTALYKQKPKALLMLENNNDKYRLGQKVSIKEIYEYFTNEYEFNPKTIRDLFIKNPEIFNSSLKEIIEFTNYFKDTLELSKVIF